MSSQNFFLHLPPLTSSKPGAPGDYNLSAQDTYESILRACLARLRSWAVPPNWSRSDWYQEIEQVAAIAAWQAARDYDPSFGCVIAGFIYNRIMARARSRYRQEWAYGLRFVPDAEEEEGDPGDLPLGNEVGRSHLTSDVGWIPAHGE